MGASPPRLLPRAPRKTCSVPRQEHGAALGAGLHGRQLTLLRRSDTCGFRTRSGRGTERQQLPAAQQAALLRRRSAPASEAANQRAASYPGTGCQSPSVYPPYCSRRLESPSSRCSCQRPGRPAGRSPAGGAARRPPSPSSRRHLAAARWVDGPAQPSRPPTHARSTASMGLAPFPPRPGRKRRDGTGRGGAAAQRERPPGGGRSGSGCSWAAAPGGARCCCGCVLLTRSPKQSACIQTARLGTATGHTDPCGKTRKPLEGRRQIASHRNTHSLQGNEATGAENPHRSIKHAASVRAVCVYC